MTGNLQTENNISIPPYCSLSHYHPPSLPLIKDWTMDNVQNCDSIFLHREVVGIVSNPKRGEHVSVFIFDQRDDGYESPG
jgi:hypothetical protein